MPMDSYGWYELQTSGGFPGCCPGGIDSVPKYVSAKFNEPPAELWNNAKTPKTSPASGLGNAVCFMGVRFFLGVCGQSPGRMLDIGTAYSHMAGGKAQVFTVVREYSVGKALTDTGTVLYQGPMRSAITGKKYEIKREKNGTVQCYEDSTKRGPAMFSASYNDVDSVRGFMEIDGLHYGRSYVPPFSLALSVKFSVGDKRPWPESGEPYPATWRWPSCLIPGESFQLGGAKAESLDGTGQLFCMLYAAPKLSFSLAGGIAGRGSGSGPCGVTRKYGWS